MKLNFYMEIAGFIITLFLCIATCSRYHVIDLKDRIYVRLAHILTVFSGMNILSYLIIRNNVYVLEKIAEIGIYMSFWLLVWILYYIHVYIEEAVNRNNKISLRACVIYGLPSLCNLIILFANMGTNCVFELTQVDSSIKVIFNRWYIAPYICAIVSLFMGVFYTIFKYRKIIINKKQKIFFVIPILFVFAYYIQYQFKAVATFGFSCAFIMLLLYLYSYNYYEKLDHLTDLPNGHSFRKMIAYRLGNEQQMMVAMININEFKYVNQEYGYDNGDLFIKAISDYLVTTSPKNCVAHLGADRFGVVLDGVTDENARAWSEKIIARFDEPWKINKIEHKLTVSIAIVECPVMCDNIMEIQQVLGLLLKDARKHNLSRCIVYDDTYKEKIQRRSQITSILKDVINNGNMFVVYQPIYDTVNNAFTKGEALFRLKDPTLGDISPAEFFPIAEEHGYVIDIGYVLIDKVCQYIKSFIQKGLTPPVISVNFSRQQLMAENVGEKLISILKQYDLRPEHIAIELPEDVFAIRYEHVKQQMNHLNQLGFHFYLDGFGTGFLDLSHLMELPFELIKINKKMIRDAEKNDTIYLLVSAMTAVFEENGIGILGDGIESQRLKDITDMLFMDYSQGYYYSEPVSDENATEFFLKQDVFERNLEAYVEQSFEHMEACLGEDMSDIHNLTFEMNEEEVNEILGSIAVGKE